MRAVLLVAAREIRQTLRTRGFWVTLLSVPLVIAVSIAAAHVHGGRTPGAYLVLDATGRYAPAIEARLRQEFPDEAAAAPLPDGPTPDAIGALFARPVVTRAGPRRLTLAISIPRDFGAGGPARIWTAGEAAGSVEAVRFELTRALRREALAAAGVPADAAARIEAAEAPVAVGPPPGAERPGAAAARSALPAALVYLLLVTALTTGSLMLQGVIEERANKLLESVLACIGPGELMYGKLLGIGALGLMVAVVWAGCALAAALAPAGSLGDLLRPSLAALGRPGLLAWILFYFLAGYLMIGAAFLAIGSLSDSMQDAQAYLTPLMVLVAVPPSFIVQATLHDPDSRLVQALAWAPIYAPFAMLARLGAGPPLAQLVGTAVELVAFTALELVLLGRLFRASLLRSGQPPRLAAIIRLMLRSPDA